MKEVLFTIIILFSFLGFSQNETKPIYYYDVNGLNISKKVHEQKASRFNSLNERYFSLQFENDTCFIRVLKRRKNYGKLNEQQLEILFTNFNAANTKPSEKYTIIQFHPGRDACNDGRFRSNGIKNNIYDKRYIKKLKKKFDCNILWIHKKDESIKFNSVGYIDWQLDKNQFVEKLFFEHHYPCNSFVIINNSNGNYISLLGESGGNTVIEILEEMTLN